MVTRFNLGNRFDPQRMTIRPASVGPLSSGQQISEKPPNRSVILLGLAGLVAGFVLGIVAGWPLSGLDLVPLVVGAVLSLAGAFPLTGGQAPRSRAYLVACIAIGIPGSGVLCARELPDHNLRTLAMGILIVAALFIIMPGLVLALRDSWLTRQVTWLVPLSVSIFAPLAFWFGGMYDTEYLDRFGIPSSAVPVSTIDRLGIASKSGLIGLGLVLFFVAAAGWSRYFQWLSDTNRWLPLLTITVVAGTYFLTAIDVGLSRVDSASASTAVQASAGKQPSEYFGMHGVLVCVSPVAASVPVYNGPMPWTRPVLSFGVTGSQLWVWDPQSHRAVSVPLDDVSVTHATATPAHC